MKTNATLSVLPTRWDKYCYPILLTLFLLWMCVGVFPLYCYESDSMHTILGCGTLYRQGFTLPPVYSYAYDMQPLIYYLVAGVNCLVPFATCEQVFCLLTAVAAMLTVVASISFVHRLTGIRKEIVLLAFFLLPEVAAIGMYPNTAIFAMLPFVVALLCLSDGRMWTGVALLCVAPLFRVDIVMVYPVVFPLFLWSGDKFSPAVRKSATAAVAVVLCLVAGYWLLQANPLGNTLDGYGEWNNRISLKQNFYAIFTFYTALGFLLFPMGIYRIWKQKNFRLLAVVLVPVVLNHLVYSRMGCATKHFLYIAPFVVAGFAYALTCFLSLAKAKKAWRYVLGIALFVYLFGSIRFDVPSRPWLNQSYSKTQTGPCLTLCKVPVGGLTMKFGVGAGFVVSTADELMLASGNFLLPFYIHQRKTELENAYLEAYDYLKPVEGDYVLWGIDWDGEARFPFLLQTKDGYEFRRKKGDMTTTVFAELTDKGRRIEVLHENILKNSGFNDVLSERENCLRKAFSLLPVTDKPIYVLINGDALIYFLDRFAQEGLVDKLADGLYQINLNRIPR